MPSLADIGSQTGAQAWLYLPVAVLLGALHGLEPGHSKTMMGAFIVAVRGTVAQAILLGLSAALSHTAIVWLVALGGQALLRGSDAESVEPYFQIAAGVLVFAIAAWMLWQAVSARRHTASGTTPGPSSQAHEGHAHPHAADVRRIDTSQGRLALEIFEDGVPPRWRIRFEDGHRCAPDDVGLLIRRPGGIEQRFAFAASDAVLESVEVVPEPHAFEVRLSLGHAEHARAYDLTFAEPDDHGHHHGHPHRHHHHHRRAPSGLAAIVGAAEGDAHERQHAREIGRRFADRDVTTTQIVLFGLTGGLIPCPAAITVLLLCLQLEHFALAVALVFCFSAGVAATMVAAGVIAALGARHLRSRWFGLDTLSDRAPYASSALMIVVALYVGVSGWLGLPTR